MGGEAITGVSHAVVGRQAVIVASHPGGTDVLRDVAISRNAATYADGSRSTISVGLRWRGRTHQATLTLDASETPPMIVTMQVRNLCGPSLLKVTSAPLKI